MFILLLTITSLSNTQNTSSNSDEFIKQRIEFLDNLDAEQYKSDNQKLLQGRKVAIGGSIIAASIMLLTLLPNNKENRDTIMKIGGLFGAASLLTGGVIGTSDYDKFNNRKHEKAHLVDALSKKN
jgi:hypothetical protein